MIQRWKNFGNRETVFGVGSLQQRLETLKGRKILLMSSPGSVQRGDVDRSISLLDGSNSLVVDTSTAPNPTISQLNYLIKSYGDDDIDLIVAIGGGSVIDAAKVLSYGFCDTQGSVSKLLSQSAKTEGRKLEVIAVPTTSGTGAEVTPFATVWDDVNQKKYSLGRGNLAPDEVVLDPQLTRSLPPKIRIDCALDALSHSLESLWNRKKTVMSEVCSLNALNLMSLTLPKIIGRKSDVQTHGSQMLASHFAGLAISQTKTALAHSISYPLTSKYAIPHGLACSFTLPVLLDRNKEYMTELMGADLLSKIRSALGMMDFQSRITDYASVDEVFDLVDEMYSPERAENYIEKVDGCILNTILKQSL